MSSGDDLTAVLMIALRASSTVTKRNSSSVGPEYDVLGNMKPQNFIK